MEAYFAKVLETVFDERGFFGSKPVAIEQAKNMQAKALIPATIKFKLNNLI